MSSLTPTRHCVDCQHATASIASAPVHLSSSHPNALVLCSTGTKTSQIIGFDKLLSIDKEELCKLAGEKPGAASGSKRSAPDPAEGKGKKEKKEAKPAKKAATVNSTPECAGESRATFRVLELAWAIAACRGRCKARVLRGGECDETRTFSLWFSAGVLQPFAFCRFTPWLTAWCTVQGKGKAAVPNDDDDEVPLLPQFSRDDILIKAHSDKLQASSRALHLTPVS